MQDSAEILAAQDVGHGQGGILGLSWWVRGGMGEGWESVRKLLERDGRGVSKKGDGRGMGEG